MTTTTKPPAVIQTRQAHHLIRDTEAGADSLHALVSGWSPLAPKRGELTAAEATVEGLRRCLGELRIALGYDDEDQ